VEWHSHFGFEVYTDSWGKSRDLTSRARGLGATSIAEPRAGHLQSCDMFHVEHFVRVSMYVHVYMYIDRQMKQREQVTRRRKIGSLQVLTSC
jgi:hypothetical protein